MRFEATVIWRHLPEGVDAVELTRKLHEFAKTLHPDLQTDDDVKVLIPRGFLSAEELRRLEDIRFHG